MYPGVHAVTHPDKPAVIMADGSDRVLTYAVLEDRSRRIAHLLADAGLGRGDHVAMVCDNRPEAMEVYWGALRSGCYITAVNWHLSAAEAAYIVDDCGAEVLFTSATVPGAADIGAAAAGPRVRLALGGAVAGHDDYEEALAAASTAPLADQPRGSDMLYSSGTTGRPKGILPALTELQIEDEHPFNRLLIDAFGFDAESSYLSVGPIYHSAPLRFSAMVHSVGGTVVMMDRFDAVTGLAAIDRYRVTHSQWVPTHFVRLLRLPEEVRAGYVGADHRVAIHGAAPCPVEVKQAMIDWWGPILIEFYGATEGNGLTVIDTPEWLSHPGSVGRAWRGVPHVCADDGTEVTSGGTGTLWFEHARPPFAYHGDPAKTAAATHPAHPNWMTTGDMGRVDADGYVYLTDRQAFMIISGGVNIYPQEIEDALTLHPAVADVAVIGVPDDEMGESVLAVVEPAEGTEGGNDLAEELRAYLRGRIAGYKVPRAVTFVDQLPRSPAGKLVKGPLRERYAAGLPGAGR